MAIIRSLAMGKARKSAGNITFRTVRGRTIASEKRGKMPVTRPGLGMTQFQFTLSVISSFMRSKRSDIDLSFDKTKFGSQSNGFMKLNYQFLKRALQPLFDAGKQPSAITILEIVTALDTFVTANPDTIIRVKKAGYPIVYLSGVWSSSDNPTPPITNAGFTIDEEYHPLRFVPGDAVVVIGVVDITPVSDFFYLRSTGIGDSGATPGGTTVFDKAGEVYNIEEITRVDANTLRFSNGGNIGETTKMSYVVLKTPADISYVGAYIAMA